MTQTMTQTERHAAPAPTPLMAPPRWTNHNQVVKYDPLLNERGNETPAELRLITPCGKGPGQKQAHVQSSTAGLWTGERLLGGPELSSVTRKEQQIVRPEAGFWLWHVDTGGYRHADSRFEESHSWLITSLDLPGAERLIAPEHRRFARPVTVEHYGQAMIYPATWGYSPYSGSHSDEPLWTPLLMVPVDVFTATRDDESLSEKVSFETGRGAQNTLLLTPEEFARASTQQELPEAERLARRSCDYGLTGIFVEEPSLWRVGTPDPFTMFVQD